MVGRKWRGGNGGGRSRSDIGCLFGERSTITAGAKEMRTNTLKKGADHLFGFIAVPNESYP